MDGRGSVAEDCAEIAADGGYASSSSIEFSTQHLPVARQFDAWREHCAPVIECWPLPDRPPGYAVRFRLWKFGHFAFSTVTSPAFGFRRTEAQIRRDSLDHWQINLVRKGTTRIRIDGADLWIPAGVPHILSLDQSFDGERGDAEWLSLYVSRDAFTHLAPALDACWDTPLTSAMGGVLASFMDGLAATLPDMPTADLPRLSEATRAVIAACITPNLPNEPGEATVKRARLGRIRQIIRQNLRSTRLGPDRLCKLAGVSRSQLYRLFEPFGGVARYIQSERLRQAHRAIADQSHARDIIRVAEDFGFFDPSAFSRAFRREFGYAPSQLRAAAQCGWFAAPARKGGEGALAGSDFVSTLRRL
ncbi:helix-turn-helix domain-containing protein [Roseococcus sp. YIM B11640]|uniref:helix-turn-helix domain-containing protein n=1 Tax=Roseococcus sp. YIM B11640 TaxID=3133973 RepID=UPI003C7D6206